MLVDNLFAYQCVVGTRNQQRSWIYCGYGYASCFYRASILLESYGNSGQWIVD